MGAHDRAAVPSEGLVRTSVGALGRRGGFTLIELLVVIGIIAVLAAIVIPVYTRAQEKARQATCLSNMHSIAVAIRMYQQDYRAFPATIDSVTGNPTYAYDPITGEGGITTLRLSEYISSSKALRCPNDQTTVDQYIQAYRDLVPSADQAAFETFWRSGRNFLDRYSSYNCDHSAIQISGGAPAGPYQLYNGNGYAVGTDGLSLLDTPASFGSKYPGLCNRWAPDETIVTHCPYHRDFFGNQARWQDAVVRVGGDAKFMVIANYDWVNQPPD
jgi:prepilin-type N-terminal cleavage/methylation domain-containing protein